MKECWLSIGNQHQFENESEMCKVECLLNPLNIQISLWFDKFGLLFVDFDNILIKNSIYFILLKLRIIDYFRLYYCFEIIMLILKFVVMSYFCIILVIVLNTHCKFVLLTHIDSFKFTRLQFVGIPILHYNIELLLYRFNIFVF